METPDPERALFVTDIIAVPPEERIRESLASLGPILNLAAEFAGLDEEAIDTYGDPQGLKCLLEWTERHVAHVNELCALNKEDEIILEDFADELEFMIRDYHDTMANGPEVGDDPA